MKYRKATLGLAIGLGLMAAYLITSYIKNIKVEIAGGAKQVEVLVAVDDLPTGITLDELHSRELVKAKTMPQEFIAADSLAPDDQLGDRVLAVNVSKNEQLTNTKFKVPKEAGLSLATPNSKIAVAIPTSEMRAVANLIKIGDYVNVIGTLKDAAGQQITKTILQRVQVLALGSNLDDSAKNTSSGGGLGSGGQRDQTITLALSQQEAEKLVFVQEQGQIWLTLVPPAQGETGVTPGQTLTTILK